MLNYFLSAMPLSGAKTTGCSRYFDFVEGLSCCVRRADDRRTGTPSAGKCDKGGLSVVPRASPIQLLLRQDDLLICGVLDRLLARDMRHRAGRAIQRAAVGAGL